MVVFIKRSITTSKPHTSYEEGRGGAVVRALASHQCGSGLIPGEDVEFVVASRPSSPGTSVFSPPQKPNFSNFNSTWKGRSPLNEFLERTLVLHR